MPPPATQTEANPHDNPNLGDEPILSEGPPEEEFWERYNKRLEFPLGTVAAVLLHIIVGAVLVFLLVGLMNNEEDRSNTPLELKQVGGIDDIGEGSPGSGTEDKDKEAVNPFAGAMQFASPEKIADAKVSMQKFLMDDPTSKPLPIAIPNADAYDRLDKTLRDKLLSGGRKGDDQAGKGPGGNGADSTRARGLRWVLRFRINGGRDYINQLKVMKAEILIPLPPDNKKCIIIRDLDNPTAANATDADLSRLAGKIQFSDNRPMPVREVIDTLGITPRPNASAFWAFFPKEMEDELAHKEKGYRNRRSEDIEETVFKVTIRGGKAEVVVEDQVVKGR